MTGTGTPSPARGTRADSARASAGAHSQAGATSRQVWRCSRATLVLVIVLMVIVGIAIPAAAAISLATGLTAFGGQQVPVLAIIGGLAAIVLVFGWRLGLHPKLVLDDDQIEVVNPFRRARFELADITVIEPGGDGLLIGTPQRQADAWCVQKSTAAARSGRLTRADRIADQLRMAWGSRHLPDPDPGSPLRFRFARRGEEELLTGLERAASLARLGHIFPPETHPYPTDAVRRRWQLVLDDRTRLTMIAELGGVPAGYVCYGREVIHHLGVAAEFQRQGVGTALLDAAEDDLFADLSTPELSLWVLAANGVARRFYATLGWTATEETRNSEFPPHPSEIKMSRRNPHIARRGR